MYITFDTNNSDEVRAVQHVLATLCAIAQAAVEEPSKDCDEEIAWQCASELLLGTLSRLPIHEDLAKDVFLTLFKEVCVEDWIALSKSRASIDVVFEECYVEHNILFSVYRIRRKRGQPVYYRTAYTINTPSVSPDSSEYALRDVVYSALHLL
jgi:hypothetical protein